MQGGMRTIALMIPFTWGLFCFALIFPSRSLYIAFVLYCPHYSYSHWFQVNHVKFFFFVTCVVCWHIPDVYDFIIYLFVGFIICGLAMHSHWFLRDVKVLLPIVRHRLAFLVYQQTKSASPVDETIAHPVSLWSAGWLLYTQLTE